MKRAALRAHAVPMACVLAFALLSAQLSWRLRSDTMASTFQAELNILSGQSTLPEFQNRVLSPSLLLLARSVAPASMSDATLWHGLRTGQAAAAFLLIYLSAWRLSRSRLRAALAMVMMTYAYVWTPMTLTAEHTSDFFDMMFVALAVWLVVEDRPVLLSVVAALGATNRESSAFAGVIWCAVWIVRDGGGWWQWRTWIPGLAASGMAVAVVVGIRYFLSPDFQPEQRLGIFDTAEHWRWLFHPMGSGPMFLATLLPFWVALRALRRPWSAIQRGLFLSALGCAAVTLTFGIATELRVWLPVWVILSLLIVAGCDYPSDESWITSILHRCGPARHEGVASSTDGSTAAPRTSATDTRPQPR